jgi:tRNA A37 methylthiotransferase MiaB
MKVHLKALNPCRLRNVQVKQYADFMERNGSSLVANPAECDCAIVWTCGVHGDSRRAARDSLLSVFGLLISQGGRQQVINRVSHAIKPHSGGTAEVVGSASVAPCIANG